MADQTQCKYLLELKDTDYSLIMFFRLNWGKYLRLFLILALGVYFALESGMPRYVGLFVCGMSVSAFLRDLGWLVKIKKNWPLTVRITNWELVRNIAEGKDSVS